MNPTRETPYGLIGEAGIAAIVDAFYDRLSTDAAYARLRGLHGRDLGPIRHGLKRFLAGWLGGPRDWFERGQCIMSVHRSIPIDAELADQWSGAMMAAIADQPDLDPGLADHLGKALTNFAHAMINRPALHVATA